MATTEETRLRLRRWKRVEYERLIEVGMFQPGERLELIDGLLLVREPQGSDHAAGIRRVLGALRRVLGPEWQLDCQLPIALDDDSEPEPDVAVVPHDPDLYRAAHPTHPVLVVEVADSSYRVDHTYKTSLYARARVPECWIIDLRHETVEIHRDPEASPDTPYGWRYRTVQVLRAPATVAPLIVPARAIPVADLLP
jgi:Uma2 family endonuclease